MLLHRLLVVSVIFVACIANAETPRETVSAFRKLGAKLEIGLNYNDYLRELGDLSFTIKEYDESAEASNNPLLTSALDTAFLHYKFAQGVWELKLKASRDTSGRFGRYERAGYFMPYDKNVKAIAEIYPNILTPVDEGGALHEDYVVMTQVLSVIWGRAKKELVRASELTKKP